MGREHLIDDELKVRKITTEMENFLKEYDKDADLATIGINDKNKHTKLDEAMRMVWSMRIRC